MNFIEKCGRKCTHYFVGLTLMVAWLLMLYVGYLILFPIKTIDVLTQPLPIDPKVIHAGSDDYHVRVDYIKYIDADIHTARHIECEDGSIWNLKPVERNFPVGEGTIIMNHTEIPKAIPEGKCKLVYTVNYQVNPLKLVTQRFETEEFQVIK